MDLGILSQDFPSISSTPTTGNLASCGTPTRTCSCPARTSPPPPPTSLPLPATAENREKLKTWIEGHYGSSAFNQCQHQQLPLMTDLPPLQLNAEPRAKPVAVHQPVSIPIHWVEQDKAELNHDVRLGVFEVVPMGEPTAWSSRMVV